MTAYGITVKCIKQGVFPSEEQLLSVFLDCINRHKGDLLDYTFEHDSINRLHIHGLFRARKGIRKNLFKKLYHTIHIDQLDTAQDIETWLNYIHKGEYKEFLDLLNSGEYMFQDPIND